MTRSDLAGLDLAHLTHGADPALAAAIRASYEAAFGGRRRQQWWQRRVCDPHEERCGADVHMPPRRRISGCIHACRADDGRPIRFREALTAAELLENVRRAVSWELQRPESGGPKGAVWWARRLARGGSGLGPGADDQVTPEDVAAIGARVAAETITAIAADLGVSRATVRYVWRRDGRGRRAPDPAPARARPGARDRA